MNCGTTRHEQQSGRRARRGSGFAITAIAAALSAGAQAQAPAAWPAALYNPATMPDDVVLPMPCGGSMAFRRVLVPSADVLDDRRVQLGNADARFAYAENARTDYVGGGFVDTKVKNQRYYLIGKYEVTQAQFATLAGACAAPTETARLPKTALTWPEAVAFAGRYSEWLVKNAAGKLPTEDGAFGFARLPTEAEWEFAARGGVAVTPDAFEAPAFPMPEGPARYVWYAGTDSSNNELQAIGVLKPNPIGAFDMLGNAGEFVLDPFRLNKYSRLHGQAGGYTIKGGDYRTAVADIRSASRIEYVPVDKNGERRDKGTGMRLAIVSVSVPTTQSLASVKSLWGGLAQSTPSAGGPPQADPVKEVEALAAATTDPAIKRRIEGVGTVIKASIQARNEQRDRAAKSQIQVGAYLGRKIIADTNQMGPLKSMAENAASPDDRKAFAVRVKASEAAIDDTSAYLVDTLRQIGLDVPAAVITAQGEILKREFEARGRAGYSEVIGLVVRNAQSVRGGKSIDRAAVAAELARIK